MDFAILVGLFAVLICLYIFHNRRSKTFQERKKRITFGDGVLIGFLAIAVLIFGGGAISVFILYVVLPNM